MTVQKKIIRVLIGKLGLDGHDRGAKVIARSLREAGMEVVYTGRRKTPSDIAKIAVEEDVDVIGISLLSGGHESLIPELCRLLRENQAADIPVIVGGIIPIQDVPDLEKAGVQKVFGPGTKAGEIINCIRELSCKEMK